MTYPRDVRLAEAGCAGFGTVLLVTAVTLHFMDAFFWPDMWIAFSSGLIIAAIAIHNISLSLFRRSRRARD